MNNNSLWEPKNTLIRNMEKADLLLLQKKLNTHSHNYHESIVNIQSFISNLIKEYNTDIIQMDFSTIDENLVITFKLIPNIPWENQVIEFQLDAYWNDLNQDKVLETVWGFNNSLLSNCW